MRLIFRRAFPDLPDRLLPRLASDHLCILYFGVETALTNGRVQSPRWHIDNGPMLDHSHFMRRVTFWQDRSGLRIGRNMVYSVSRVRNTLNSESFLYALFRSHADIGSAARRVAVQEVMEA